jgi:hypothetical protein
MAFLRQKPNEKLVFWKDERNNSCKLIATYSQTWPWKWIVVEVTKIVVMTI